MVAKTRLDEKGLLVINNTRSTLHRGSAATKAKGKLAVD